MTSASRKKIAILGGGVAALTAALELTEQDPDQSQYDITIYTLGWRLGGKCASRRDMDNYGRAYEHGLHVWAGFYDNAFHVIQILYKALGEDEGAWGRCFEPLNHFTVTEYVGGHWLPWLISAPTNDLDPGIMGPPTCRPSRCLWIPVPSRAGAEKQRHSRSSERRCSVPRRTGRHRRLSWPRAWGTRNDSFRCARIRRKKNARRPIAFSHREADGRLSP